MGRPERPVDASGGPVAAFARDLRRLREHAGTPTYRDMARRALFSASVLSSAASGRHLPTLPVTLAFVAACGGDQQAWRRRWWHVRGDDGEDAAVPTRPRPQDQPVRQNLPRPAQLPLRPRGFVARAEELRLLTGRGPTTPVVVNGPVGVGKTEFALHLAHNLSATMVDGQLYADFGELAIGERGAETVLDGFLSALGVPPDRLPAAADQHAGLYRSILVDRRVVVLLDNVRDEGQVRPLLAETRRSLTIIVSRTALLGLRDVSRVRLDVLPRSESIAMIAAGVPDHAEADPQACDQLAEICGDLPLALDIAVRRLVARPDVQLREVVHRLAEPGAALDWLRIGDLSVRESLGSAYRRLGLPARILLHQLAGLRADGCLPRQVAEELVEESTEELVEAGMVRRQAGADSDRVDPLTRAFVLGQALLLDACRRRWRSNATGSSTGSGRPTSTIHNRAWPRRPAPLAAG